jgi:hypothetical protein
MHRSRRSNVLMVTCNAVRRPGNVERWAPSRKACGAQSSCEPKRLEGRYAAITAGRNRHEAGQRSASVAQYRGAAANMRCCITASQREGRAGRWLDYVEMGWCSWASPNNGMHRSAGSRRLIVYQCYSPRPVMRVRYATLAKCLCPSATDVSHGVERRGGSIP